MTYQEIVNQYKKKSTLLCVGLDTDISRLPRHILTEDDPIFAFNKQIIDATADYCIAYKPNLAFYEAYGAKGWESLKKTVEYIPKDIFTIADAKRGDIGNTAGMYAKAFFEEMSFDAVTISPYMGRDSIDPFLAYPDKWTIVLARTSNASSNDFQELPVGEDYHLYQSVIETSSKWCGKEQMMYVVGATQPESLQVIRKMVPEHFFLVPGVGAQGGNMDEVIRYGSTGDGGLLINSSRQIIYASPGQDFQQQAGKEARKLQQQMEQMLNKYS